MAARGTLIGLVLVVYIHLWASIVAPSDPARGSGIPILGVPEVLRQVSPLPELEPTQALSLIGLCLAALLYLRLRRSRFPFLGPTDDRVASLTSAWSAKAVRSGLPVIWRRESDQIPEGDGLVGAAAGDSGISEILRRGQDAARRGDRQAAYQCFVEALSIDFMSDEAWLWLGGTVERPEEAIRCLKRALEINPANQRARLGLNQFRSECPSSSG